MNNEDVNIFVIEKDRKRDPDGIMSGVFKVTLDGLVAAGIISNDTQRWVKKLSFDLGPPNRKDPRVFVHIKEAQK